MKKVLFILAILTSLTASAQSYKYYFYSIRPTGKMEVELVGQYQETDSLLVDKIEVNKKGDSSIVYKKFRSYSDAFNALSAAGLEYVEFRNLSVVGGATRMLVGDVRVDWVIWRKRVE